MELSGSVALVTGASRGIGAAIVDALVGAGVKRVYAAMRTPTSASTAAVVPVALDVTDPARIAAVARELGDVSILVNNAGISRSQPAVGATDRGAAEEEMRANYLGPLEMIRAFAPVLAKNAGGAIVNVLSILARVPAPGAGTYSASKAAALSMTQAVRGELAHQGTLVVGVMPGFVDTDMVKRLAVAKISAGNVAGAIVEALRAGIEDVYPGPAAEIAAELLRDPKGVERRIAAMLPARRSEAR